MTHQRRKNRRLSDLAENYEAPSFNEYMDLKWQEIRLKQREKVEERKRNLEKLEQSVRRQRAKSADSRRLKQTRKRREALNGGGEGKLIRGMTFNIEFKTVPRVS